MIRSVTGERSLYGTGNDSGLSGCSCRTPSRTPDAGRVVHRPLLQDCQCSLCLVHHAQNAVQHLEDWRERHFQILIN